jgi:hypothetical protein
MTETDSTQSERVGPSTVWQVDLLGGIVAYFLTWTMRARVRATAVTAVFVLATACGSGSSGSDQAATTEDNGDFVLTMEKALPADAHVEQLVRASDVAREAVDGLNEQFALPENINIVFAAEDPDESGPFFDPETNTVTLQYPTLTADREIFIGYDYDPDEADDAVLSDVLFTLYHELGHALIANFELPVTGREEDAVDGLSAVILDDTYEDGQDIVLDNADWFAAIAAADEDGHDFSDFADEHSLNEQRYVTLLCLAYGSAPKDYADLIDDDLLPEARAEGCEDEYDQVRTSWDTLLAPWEKE